MAISSFDPIDLLNGCLEGGGVVSADSLTSCQSTEPHLDIGITAGLDCYLLTSLRVTVTVTVLHPTQ